jgi:hypothetical protein
MSAGGEASMTAEIVFTEKHILVRAIVVKAETPHSTVSLKRGVCYTLTQRTSITIYLNTTITRRHENTNA